MANLAQELGVAGVQVLREQFGLTRSEAIQWFDATIERAHANRQASAHALKSACADKPRG